MAKSKTVTVVGAGKGQPSAEFREVARQLKVARGEGQKRLRKNLKEAGEIVATEARAIASEHSEKIPRSIRVRTSGATVSIVEGGPKAPNAAPFEVGNAGDRRSLSVGSLGGTFRHPVFGNRQVWVEQPMHPAVRPAIARKLDLMTERVADAEAQAIADALDLRL